MKPHTIQNTFCNSGMWPVSLETGVQKMRSYAKSTRKKAKSKTKQGSPVLLIHPITQTEYALNKWIEQDPLTLSSPSRKRHVETLKKAKVQLNYAHLIESKHQASQAQLLEDQKRRISSRKSFQKGGAISVTAARKKKQERIEKEKNDAIQKVETAMKRQVSKATKALYAQGVQACREEKERKKLIQGYLARGKPLPIGIEIPI